MQVKTIKRIIEAKIEDWLSTIPNEVLRDDIRNSLIVTGGSIASMLLKEKVNDFDIYLSNMDVLKRLCEHYLVGSTINILDGRNKNLYLSNLKESYKSGYEFDEIKTGYKIILENLKIDQIKLQDDLESGVKFDILEDNEKKYQLSFVSPNAISLTDDIQIITRFTGDVKTIHKNYDFIHATNYYTNKDGIVLNLAALESLITKQLKYQGSYYPVTSIIRVKKFINRGWTISAGEMLKIIFQASLLDLTNVNILEEQLIGVDVAYFGILIKALQNVDKDIDFNYLSVLIDKVFNNDKSEI